MKPEPTGNFAFDYTARQLDKQLDEVCLTPKAVDDELVDAALSDDGVVSAGEQLVIDRVMAKAIAQVPLVDEPAAPAPPKPAAKGQGAADTNFYTFFLNFSQLPQGKALGLKPAYDLAPGEPVGAGVIVETNGHPHLTLEKSDQFAQSLGFQDAEDLQTKVGAKPDGLIGPATIQKLNVYAQSHDLYS